ncbi:MAG: lipoprotein 17-related variable surface protein [Mycoplasma sp.]|nr:lipoprotein 17-related variable surface protein [Mycoplasma sp.]
MNKNTKKSLFALGLISTAGAITTVASCGHTTQNNDSLSNDVNTIENNENTPAFDIKNSSDLDIVTWDLDNNRNSLSFQNTLAEFAQSNSSLKKWLSEHYKDDTKLKTFLANPVFHGDLKLMGTFGAKLLNEIVTDGLTYINGPNSPLGNITSLVSVTYDSITLGEVLSFMFGLEHGSQNTLLSLAGGYLEGKLLNMGNLSNYLTPIENEIQTLVGEIDKDSISNLIPILNNDPELLKDLGITTTLNNLNTEELLNVAQHVSDILHSFLSHFINVGGVPENQKALDKDGALIGLRILQILNDQIGDSVLPQGDKPRIAGFLTQLTTEVKSSTKDVFTDAKTILIRTMINQIDNVKGLLDSMDFSDVFTSYIINFLTNLKTHIDANAENLDSSHLISAVLRSAAENPEETKKMLSLLKETRIFEVLLDDANSIDPIIKLVITDEDKRNSLLSIWDTKEKRDIVLKTITSLSNMLEKWNDNEMTEAVNNLFTVDENGDVNGRDGLKLGVFLAYTALNRFDDIKAELLTSTNSVLNSSKDDLKEFVKSVLTFIPNFVKINDSFKNYINTNLDDLSDKIATILSNEDSGDLENVKSVLLLVDRLKLNGVSTITKEDLTKLVNDIESILPIQNNKEPLNTQEVVNAIYNFMNHGLSGDNNANIDAIVKFANHYIKADANGTNLLSTLRLPVEHLISDGIDSLTNDDLTKLSTSLISGISSFKGKDAADINKFLNGILHGFSSKADFASLKNIIPADTLNKGLFGINLGSMLDSLYSGTSLGFFTNIAAGAVGVNDEVRTIIHKILTSGLLSINENEIGKLLSVAQGAGSSIISTFLPENIKKYISNISANEQKHAIYELLHSGIKDIDNDSINSLVSILNSNHEDLGLGEILSSGLSNINIEKTFNLFDLISTITPSSSSSTISEAESLSLRLLFGSNDINSERTKIIDTLNKVTIADEVQLNPQFETLKTKLLNANDVYSKIKTPYSSLLAKANEDKAIVLNANSNIESVYNAYQDFVKTNNLINKRNALITKYNNELQQINQKVSSDLVSATALVKAQKLSSNVHVSDLNKDVAIGSQYVATSSTNDGAVHFGNLQIVGHDDVSGTVNMSLLFKTDHLQMTREFSLSGFATQADVQRASQDVETIKNNIAHVVTIKPDSFNKDIHNVLTGDFNINNANVNGVKVAITKVTPLNTETGSVRVEVSLSKFETHEKTTIDLNFASLIDAKKSQLNSLEIKTLSPATGTTLDDNFKNVDYPLLQTKFNTLKGLSKTSNDIVVIEDAITQIGEINNVIDSYNTYVKGLSTKWTNAIKSIKFRSSSYSPRFTHFEALDALIKQIPSDTEGLISGTIDRTYRWGNVHNLNTWVLAMAFKLGLPKTENWTFQQWFNGIDKSRIKTYGHVSDQQIMNLAKALDKWVGPISTQAASPSEKYATFDKLVNLENSATVTIATGKDSKTASHAVKADFVLPSNTDDVTYEIESLENANDNDGSVRVHIAISSKQTKVRKTIVVKGFHIPTSTTASIYSA